MKHAVRVFSRFFIHLGQRRDKKKKCTSIYIYTHTEAETAKRKRVTHKYSNSNIANSSLGVHNTPYIQKQVNNIEKNRRRNKEYSICNEG
jgi:hypothetical protein